MRWRSLLAIGLTVFTLTACESADERRPQAASTPADPPSMTTYSDIDEIVERLAEHGIACNDVVLQTDDERRQQALCLRQEITMGISVQQNGFLRPGTAAGVYGRNWLVAIGDDDRTGPRYRALATEVVAALGGEMENMEGAGLWFPDLERLAQGLGCSGLELVERPTLGAIEDGFCRVAGAKVRLRLFEKVTEPPRLTLPFRARGEICWVHGENWLSATRDSLAARRILETYGGTIRHECGTL